jgi:hypothetical protein
MAGLIGWSLMALGVIGAGTATLGILIGERIRIMRRREAFRRRRCGTVRKVARRGYRVDSLWGIGGGK